MKRGATDHPKMLAFAQALNVPVYAAIGLVESLIHWTARYAPRGNVGKWTDDVIARGLGWQDSGAELVSAFRSSGWLDDHDEHRLVLHDWSQHADDAVHRLLARAGELFADGGVPSTARLSGKEKEAAESALAKLRRGRTSGARRAHARRTVGALPEPRPAPPEPRPDTHTPSGGEEASGALPSGNGKPLGTVAAVITPEDLQEAWNEVAAPLGLPRILEVRGKRRENALRRIREHPTEDFWRRVFGAIPRQPFLLGNGGRGWKVSFDFLVDNDTNATRIAEGTYGEARSEPRRQFVC